VGHERSEDGPIGGLDRLGLLGGSSILFLFFLGRHGGVCSESGGGSGSVGVDGWVNVAVVVVNVRVRVQIASVPIGQEPESLVGNALA
jgi:hypothetical protein